ncbi:hypothetical protein CGLAMM_06265 [Acetobacteraceae bacterium EV16G]|uniref:cell division protein FtsQ/DivIB n=1 Tax=Sorlinia euscelidii TaxID=3081148 RepID=UPI002F3C1A54
MTRARSERKPPTRDVYLQDRPSRIAMFLRRVRRTAPQIIFVALLVAVLGGCGYLFFQQISQSRNDIFRSWLEDHTLLPINHIDIIGARLTSRAEVEKALGAARGKPIFSFAIADAQKRLSALLFVSNVTVQRRMPDTVRIVLEERDPLAIWQIKGKFMLINRDGAQIADAFGLRDHVRAFMSLPLVVGDGADKAAPDFLAALAEAPTVRPFVAASIRVGHRRWTLLLKDGTQIYLPEGHEREALKRLTLYQQKFRLLERPVPLIDMRLPDRMVIRLPQSPSVGNHVAQDLLKTQHAAPGKTPPDSRPPEKSLHGDSVPAPPARRPFRVARFLSL